MDAVVAIVPDNIFAAMGANDVLAVMFFALFFGVGLMLVSTPRTEALKTAIEGIFEVVMKLIGLVIQLAPIAVFRSEEHTSELQSLMRISYAVFCLTKKN